jgi:hypothetical protein
VNPGLTSGLIADYEGNGSTPLNGSVQAILCQFQESRQRSALKRHNGQPQPLLNMYDP